jgi:hypothetical protein
MVTSNSRLQSILKLVASGKRITTVINPNLTPIEVY